MTISELLNSAQKSNLRSEMEIYLAYLLARDRMSLIRERDFEVPVEKMSALQNAWIKILDGYPVAYLTNKKEFFEIPFYVNEDVLIPRPETEHLVNHVLNCVKSLYEYGIQTVKVVEIGTGSGAIAGALKTLNKDLEIVATDISEKALDVARRNFQNLNLEIDLIQSDLLKDVKERNFNILVTNLPYIGEVENHFIADNVRKFEPSVALFGGFDGLDLYRRMFDQILEKRMNLDFILGEIGFCHGEKIKKIVNEKFPFADLKIEQDLNGLDRHFIISLKK